MRTAEILNSSFARKMRGNNISPVTVIGVVSGNCLIIKQEQENVKNKRYI